MKPEKMPNKAGNTKNGTLPQPYALFSDNRAGIEQVQKLLGEASIASHLDKTWEKSVLLDLILG